LQGMYMAVGEQLVLVLRLHDRMSAGCTCDLFYYVSC
jgi:hypothetical protein